MATVVSTMRVSEVGESTDLIIVMSLFVIDSRAFSAASKAGIAYAKADLQSLAISSDASAAFLATAASFETASAITSASEASFSTTMVCFPTSSALTTSFGFNYSR
jgi:hypothetical protein